VAQLRDIMTTKVLTTSAERPVAEVTAMMVKARVGSAIVLQGSWLAGILTERDVLRAAASRSDLTTSPVSQWMTKDPVTATPDTTAEEAAHLMLTNGFRHLPVPEGRSLRAWSASVMSWPLGSAGAEHRSRSCKQALGCRDADNRPFCRSCIKCGRRRVTRRSTPHTIGWRAPCLVGERRRGRAGEEEHGRPCRVR
jgi:hypothetical protein